MGRVAFLLLAVGLAVVAVGGRWEEVRAALARLGAGPLAVSLLLCLAGLVAYAQCWRALLAELGSPLPVRPAGRIFFLGQLGKYLPGSVWPVLAQMELGRDHGVPRRRSAAVFVLFLAVLLAVAGILAAALLPWTAGGVVHRFRWLLVAGLALALVLHPRALSALVGVGSRLLGRPGLDRPLRGRGLAVAGGWALVSWLLLGAHVEVLAVGLGADPARALPLCLGGFALAWAAGLLVVVVPAGAGVREVVLVAVLAPVLSTPPAVALAVASRALLTVGDLICAGGFAGASRPRRRANVA